MRRALADTDTIHTRSRCGRTAQSPGVKKSKKTKISSCLHASPHHTWGYDAYMLNSSSPSSTAHNGRRQQRPSKVAFKTFSNVMRTPRQHYGVRRRSRRRRVASGDPFKMLRVMESARCCCCCCWRCSRRSIGRRIIIINTHGSAQQVRGSQQSHHHVCIWYM